MSRIREKRKREHLALARQGSRCSLHNPFNKVRLRHNALTEVDPGSTDLSGTIAGLPVANVLYINAITGGALSVEHVNRLLAAAARRHKLAMAVGSQTAALKNKSVAWTFSVARKFHPHGLLMANVPATVLPPLAQRAVDMIDAQLLQLYLNPLQELVMPEGDPISPRLLDNIAAVCAKAKVPVIVKEVGFGLMGEQARILLDLGVKAVDISGRGGTNFALIEGKRSRDRWWRPFANWGWPTPRCIADVARRVPGLDVLASGGIDDGLMAIKALALGASAAGIAGVPLRALHKGPAALDRCLRRYIKQMRVAMALTGAKSVSDLKMPGTVYGDGDEFLIPPH